ncbi:hypothetical protein GCM10010965_32000 [Caldalkalibacillus thermarum]|uniref:hypothetical protein n=1 Tax=Caldalkalibacillus thermarum TaxID=296745 RepID=UPI00166E4268|nr:hypothetical protein [Caldalkalibacillus thermarum]GGK36657.1 hypothetical protein GCM10010965_32000 [Caldalkalibacillus thermarum]
MNGVTDGYLTYDNLRASNLIFHPNCMHKITPIRDVSLLPKEVQDRFKRRHGYAVRQLNEAKRKCFLAKSYGFEKNNS